jgi:hypothetical protein
MSLVNGKLGAANGHIQVSQCMRHVPPDGGVRDWPRLHLVALPNGCRVRVIDEVGSRLRSDRRGAFGATNDTIRVEAMGGGNRSLVGLVGGDSKGDGVVYILVC